MKIITWTALKAIATAKSLQIQYTEDSLLYTIFLYDNGFTLQTTIAKTTPSNVDQSDFETNFKSSGNSKIRTLVNLTGSDGLYQVAVDSVGRMATNANITFPEVIYKTVQCVNGSNNNANVSGTLGSPISFKWSPSSGEVWYIENMTFLINDNANFPNNGFGALTALTNGAQINIKSKGSVFTFSTIKNNYEIIRTFKDEVFSSVATGLLSTDRTYRGSIRLQNRIVLDGSLGDYLELSVRDNLTGLTGLFLDALVWRTLG